MASWWLPKSGGGVRKMATLSPRDAAAWDRLGGAVAAALEPRLDGRILANRVVLNGRRWSLVPHRLGLRRAGWAAAALARRAPVVLHTDVAAFYPSVTPPALHRSLLASGVGAGAARVAASMVEGWGSEGCPGLPVGPEASAVMANAVLGTVDRAIGAFPFLRWVDDYLIALPSGRHAAEALDRLDGALADLGLTRSAPKTRLLERGELRWLGMSPTPGARSSAPGGRT